MYTDIDNKWDAFIGIVAESTIYKNQRKFRFYVPELLPIVTGDITTEYVLEDIELKNVLTNKTETASVNVTKTIVADYFGIESSRSVPTITKGMQCLIIKYGNTDKLYWLPLERNDDLKTFEHIRLSCLDTATTNKVPVATDEIEQRKEGITDKNSYFFEIDTKYKKGIVMQTSTSDGEMFSYIFEIDVAARCVTIMDISADESQPPNVIKLESRPNTDLKGRITLQNASGTSIILNGPDMHFIVPGDFTMDVKGSSNVSIGKDANYLYLDKVETYITKEWNHQNEGEYDALFSTNYSSFVKGNRNDTVEKTFKRTVTEDVIETQRNKSCVTKLTDSTNSTDYNTTAVNIKRTASDSETIKANTQAEIVAKCTSKAQVIVPDVAKPTWMEIKQKA